jgi:hypothetical protein
VSVRRVRVRAVGEWLAVEVHEDDILIN